MVDENNFSFYKANRNKYFGSMERARRWRKFRRRRYKLYAKPFLRSRIKRIILKGKKRFYLFTKDFSKLLLSSNNITVTTGMILKFFEVDMRVMRRKFVIIKLFIKFCALNLIKKNYYYYFKPLCSRINIFMQRYRFKSDWYVFYIWRHRIKRFRRIKKWVKKRYLNK